MNLASIIFSYRKKIDLLKVVMYSGQQLCRRLNKNRCNLSIYLSPLHKIHLHLYCMTGRENGRIIRALFYQTFLARVFGARQ